MPLSRQICEQLSSFSTAIARLYGVFHIRSREKGDFLRSDMLTKEDEGKDKFRLTYSMYDMKHSMNGLALHIHGMLLLASVLQICIVKLQTVGL